MSDTKWTEEQKLAINEKNSNILVAAAAGSGKTAVLVERIINKVINEKVNINDILVVTFTNAAASEMRERILEAIYKKLEEDPENLHLQKQINLLNKASICTIHAFCLDVIRNNFFEIDVSANFRIGDSTEIELIKQDVIEELFEEKYEVEDEKFLKLVQMYTNYRSDDNLKELVLKLYEFIQSIPFPEEWLKEKIEEFNYNNGIDFSETKWGKIIIDDLFLKIENCVIKLEQVYKEVAKYIELSKFSAVLIQDIENLKSINKSYKWDEIYNKVNNISWLKWPTDKKVTMDLKNEAKEVRDNVKKEFNKIISKVMVYPSGEINKDINGMYLTLKDLSELVIEFKNRFSKTKKEKNVIDFNDIEHFALDILIGKNSKKTKAAQYYMDKFIEIDVDEYQDSNLVQEYILNSISRGNNIFMVGDVKQSIYRFRQARPELFLDKYENYKLKERNEIGEKIQLFKNFRSRKNILEITNQIFKNIMSKQIGEISYTEEEFLNYGANYPEQKEKSEIYVIDVKDEEESELEEVTKTNTDDLEDEETEERIDDIILEARFVANKIKEMLNSDMEVFDKKKGKRKLENKDISILLRTTNNIAPIYEKELLEAGIKVFSDFSSTYLDSIEVQTMIALLKIIDNPIQDIPLVTILRSCIGGFSDNDLIEIRLTDKKCSFYEAMLKSRTRVNDKIKQKISKLLDRLDKWRKDVEHLSLEEFIWQIYIDTGYYHYVSLMPNGALRQANLKILFEKAREFESTNFNGLFQFINFIDKLRNSGGDLSSAKLIGENENVVRIMSIHKSKGLEFPIVFLCNMGKKFNMKDLNDNIILHQDLGLGPKYIDMENRVEYNTLAKEAIKIKAKKEIISEEERVLYVALTRAKEKLIITATSKDVKKELKDKEDILKTYNNEVKSNIVERYKSYLDWIELIYIKNDLDNLIEFNVVKKKDLIKELKNSNDEKNDILDTIRKKAEEDYNKKEIKELKERINWNYSFLNSTLLPTKTSVTKIKENTKYINAEDSIENLKIIGENKNISLDKPKFLKNNEISKAQIGTLMHMCVQRIDEKKEYDMREIKELINQLVLKQYISEEESKKIDIELLLKYTKSNIFTQIRDAKKVYKEQPFYISIPSKEIYSDVNSDEKILVQGVMDLYFIDKNDHLILVDYKTDYVGVGQEKNVVNKYAKQLEIYKKALEQSLGKKVEKSFICLANRNWNCYEIELNYGEV